MPDRDAASIRTPGQPPGSPSNPPATRSERKRQAIVAAAEELFLRQGYSGTSMDEVAAGAAVSKQTLYRHFGSKEGLFTALLGELEARVAGFVADAAGALAETTTLDEDLRALARLYAATVLRPEVLRLRRWVIAEAVRFPELAGSYHRRVPGRTLAALAANFARLHRRGLLRTPDPELAARHFAYLILGPALDDALFHPEAPPPIEADCHRMADTAVRVFLAAYRA